MTQYLNETKESLLAMVRLTTAQDDILVQLQILSDFSYAWHLIDNLTPLMQEQVSHILSTFLGCLLDTVDLLMFDHLVSLFKSHVICII